MLIKHCDHFQCRFMLYINATASEVLAKLGADHVAWILTSPRPVALANGRARGQWDANNLELMSAYQRLAVLIESGEIGGTR